MIYNKNLWGPRPEQLVCPLLNMALFINDILTVA